MSQREQLASKILEIGKAIAHEHATTEPSSSPKREGKRALEAIKWIQSALTLIEKIAQETPGILELKARLSMK